MRILSELTIDTLRVRSRRGAAPALRSAVARQLRAADLRPAAMPPAAVLIVRRLADPLPGGVRARPGALRPDARWERAARARVADLFTRAAVPAAGPVPPDAEAVRFADEAEMLAHLALDLARGRHRARWWWRALLRGVPRGDLAALLVRFARALPAAAAVLADRGELAAVAAALRPADAVRVLDALAGAYELALPLPRKAVRRAVPRRRGRPAGGPMAEGTSAPPWRPWLAGAAVRGLPAETECLWGLALALRHAPAGVRSASFARDVRSWWRAAPADVPRRPASPAPAAGAAPRSVAPRPRVTSAPPTPKPSARSRRPRLHDPRSDVPSVPGSPKARVVRPGTATTDDEAVLRSAPAPAKPPVRRRARRLADATAPAVTPAPAPPAATVSRRRRDGGPLPAPFAEDGVLTGLGGVLYLINLLLYLDLPDRFAAEVDAGVSAWGLLELLARALLEPAEAADDPLWEVLCALDGRPAGTAPDPAAGRWLDAELPAVRRRLDEALDGAAVGDVLRLAGRLYAGATHVDLVARLDDVSLPARLAGLDRDPGWVPAFGRVVRFHFE